MLTSIPESGATGNWRGSSFVRTGGTTASRHYSQKGAGHVKAIIWTLILASIVYVTVKVLPVLINEYQFKDDIQEIARDASVNRTGNDQIRQAVLKAAEKESLPVQADDVKVDLTGKTVHISADIAVTVDLSVYQWTLNFHPEASNEAIL